MTLKHVLKHFSKTEVQEDKTHPNHLSQTILNRLFGRVLEREGVSISCAEHTEKNLFTYLHIHLLTLKNKLDCFAYAHNDETHPYPPLKREGVKVSCAEHTEKNLFTYSLSKNVHLH